MDTKQIKGTTHYLYSTHIDFLKVYPECINLNHWRKGIEGEWVLTDDDGVVQILKKSSIKDKKGNKKPYIRTICGTFIINSNSYMLNEIAENIYTFSRTNEYQRFLKKEEVTGREVLFARYIANGDDSVSSYKKAYRTNNEIYAKTRSTQLLKTQRIQNMISEETKKVLDEEEVTPNYLIGRYKQIADISENDGYVLKSLDSLSKISGLFDTQEKTKEQLTVWTGFTPEQLEEIKMEKLVAHGEKTK